VPIAAGSSSDAVGRLVAERMGTALGQPIIIENVAGADGSIGVGRVARARPDGYPILGLPISGFPGYVENLCSLPHSAPATKHAMA
jgi:tripartite-type tricarboxylate transporter receptor subunit TctC